MTRANWTGLTDGALKLGTGRGEREGGVRDGEADGRAGVTQSLAIRERVFVRGYGSRQCELDFPNPLSPGLAPGGIMSTH